MPGGFSRGADDKLGIMQSCERAAAKKAGSCESRITSFRGLGPFGEGDYPTGFHRQTTPPAFYFQTIVNALADLP